jgi:NTE family protein
MRLGLVLGGGGEVGVAWETGVLAALEQATGFAFRDSAVTVGTSAGSIVGTHVASGVDLRQRVEQERAGEVVNRYPHVDFTVPAPDAMPVGTRLVPPAVVARMASVTGTEEERARAVGGLALTAEVDDDVPTFLAQMRPVLGTDVWPDADLRPTAVEAETGRTVLWDSTRGLDLVSAVSSSCAIPGYRPPIPFGGTHFFDGARSDFSGALIDEVGLDGVLFVGMGLPGLGNDDPQGTFRGAAERGVPIVAVTGGAEIATLGDELMDPARRPRAVEFGLADGRSGAAGFAALLAREAGGRPM